MSSSSTSPALPSRVTATNQTASAKPTPNTAHDSPFHAAVTQRARETGRYQRSHAVRRSRTRAGPIPVTRTSLPGPAVVAVVNRWTASRWWTAARSSASRSAAGREDAVRTVGTAKSTSSSSAGSTEASSTSVMPSRTSQASMLSTDRYMWSSTKTCCRSTASRSRYSGRSWWASEPIEASSRATWVSSAIVTLSRNRRCTRVATTLNTHVHVTEAAMPRQLSSTWVRSPAATPSASSISHSASSASGIALSSVTTRAKTSSPGSWV